MFTSSPTFDRAHRTLPYSLLETFFRILGCACGPAGQENLRKDAPVTTPEAFAGAI